MAGVEKKRVMDIKRPGKSVANATSRPVIVGHGAMMKDPMMQNKGNEAASDMPEVDHQPEDLVKAQQKAELVLAPPVAVVEADTSKPQVAETEAVPAEEKLVSTTVDTEDSKEKVSDDDKPNDATNDSIIVDTVAGQASFSKDEKIKADEEAVQQEALSKLINEKTYFVKVGQQVHRQRKNRLSIIILILLVLLVAAYLLIDAGVVKAGFSMPFHIFKQTVETSQTATNSPVQQAPVPTVVATTVTYKNTDLGLQFSYPTSWGDVTVDTKPGSIKGTSAVLTFSKQPLVRAGLLSTNYKEAGRDGTCYIVLGIMPSVKLTDIKSQVTEGDSATNSATYKMTGHIITDTTDTLVFERFEAGVSEGLGACLGASLNGYKAFTGATYTGIQFFWGDTNITTLPVADFAAYKANQNGYISDVNRQAFIKAVTSATKL